jgi:hypothetical protein
MAGDTKQPKPLWAPSHIVESDNTARLRVLEVKHEVSDLAIQKLNDKVDGIDNRLDIISKEFNVNSHATLNAITNLKSELLNKELEDLEKKHAAELSRARQDTETSAKVKFLYTGAGLLISAIIAILVGIFKTRFGG